LLIPERGRAMAMRRGPVDDQIIDSAGRNARDDIWPQKIHQFCVGTACISHRIPFGSGQNDVLAFLQHLSREHISDGGSGDSWRSTIAEIVTGEALGLKGHVGITESHLLQSPLRP